MRTDDYRVRKGTSRKPGRALRLAAISLLTAICCLASESAHAQTIDSDLRITGVKTLTNAFVRSGVTLTIAGGATVTVEGSGYGLTSEGGTIVVEPTAELILNASSMFIKPDPTGSLSGLFVADKATIRTASEPSNPMIKIEQSSARITQCTLDGIVIGDAYNLISGPLVIDDTRDYDIRIDGNRITSSRRDGGMGIGDGRIRVYQNIITYTGPSVAVSIGSNGKVSFASNTVEVDGQTSRGAIGASALAGPDSRVEIRNNLVKDIATGGFAGGISVGSCDADATVLVETNTILNFTNPLGGVSCEVSFRRNVVDGEGRQGSAPVMRLQNVEGEFTGNTVQNYAIKQPPSTTRGYEGFILHVEGKLPLRIADNTFSDNGVVETLAGDFYTSMVHLESSPITLTDNRFLSNTLTSVNAFDREPAVVSIRDDVTLGDSILVEGNFFAGNAFLEGGIFEETQTVGNLIYAYQLWSRDSIEVRRNHFDGSGEPVIGLHLAGAADSYARTAVTNNTFTGNGVGAFTIGTPSLTGGNVFRDSGTYHLQRSRTASRGTLFARSNDWGDDNPANIAALIYDSTDAVNPNINLGPVDFGDHRHEQFTVTLQPTGPLELVRGETVELSVEVRDLFGNKAVGKSVQFVQFLDSEPSIVAAIQPYVATTDENGRAVALLEATQGGETNVRALAQGARSEPLRVKVKVTLHVGLVSDQPGDTVRAGKPARLRAVVLDNYLHRADDKVSGTVRLAIRDEGNPDMGGLVQDQLQVSNGFSDFVEALQTPATPFTSSTIITEDMPISGTVWIEGTIEGTQLPPETFVSVPLKLAVASPLDFYIKDVEILQGVKDTEKEVVIPFPDGPRTFPALPLIKNHTTTVRILVDYRNPDEIPLAGVESIKGISATMTLYRPEGENLVPVYTNPRLLAGGPHPVRAPFILRDHYEQNEKHYMMDGLVDFITAENLDVSIGDYSLCLQMTFEDGLFDRGKHHEQCKLIELLWSNELPLLAEMWHLKGNTAPSEPSESDWELVADLFPIQKKHLKVTVPKWRTHELDLDNAYWSQFSDDELPARWFAFMSRELNRYNERKYRRAALVAIPGSGLIRRICGDSPDRDGCTPIGSRIVISSPSELAHHLGHAFGLGDTYGPPGIESPINPIRQDDCPSGNCVEVGNLDLQLRVQAVGQEVEIMGEAGDLALMDRVTLDHLYNMQRQQFAKRSQSSSGYLAVSGVLFEADSVALNPLVKLTESPWSPPEDGGDYRIEFEDAAGAVVDTFTFDPIFAIPGRGAVPAVPFTFNLPLPDGAAQLVIRHDEFEIARQAFSSYAPTVDLLTPAAGDTMSGVETITWTAEDADGDELTYDVVYTLGGNEPFLLAMGLDETSYEWNISTSPNALNAGSITVIASDGFNEGSDTIDGLTVLDGIATQEEEPVVEIPDTFELSQNYPNPFNPTTTIKYAVPLASHVRLIVYDALGRRVGTVLDKLVPAGRHAVMFTATDLPSGLYIYRLNAGAYKESKTMVVLK